MTEEEKKIRFAMNQEILSLRDLIWVQWVTRNQNVKSEDTFYVRDCYLALPSVNIYNKDTYEVLDELLKNLGDFKK